MILQIVLGAITLLIEVVRLFRRDDVLEKIEKKVVLARQNGGKGGKSV